MLEGSHRLSFPPTDDQSPPSLLLHQPHWCVIWTGIPQFQFERVCAPTQDFSDALSAVIKRRFYWKIYFSLQIIATSNQKNTKFYILIHLCLCPIRCGCTILRASILESIEWKWARWGRPTYAVGELVDWPRLMAVRSEDVIILRFSRFRFF